MLFHDMQNKSETILALATTSILFTIIAVSFFPIDDLKADAQSANATKYNLEPFLSLQGSTYQDIPNNESLSLSNFSISTWFKTNTNYTEPGHIVNKGGMGTDEEGMNLNYGIWINENNAIAGGFEAESGDDFIVNSSTTYNDGNWHNSLLTFNGSSLLLYVDGKLVANQSAITEEPDNTGDQPLRIGANSLDENKFFKGDVDEIRVWDRALNESEAKNTYSGNKFNTTGQELYLSYGE
jgi:concanavalin A-like lectin/glucanase superfamily protein